MKTYKRILCQRERERWEEREMERERGDNAGERNEERPRHWTEA